MSYSPANRSSRDQMLVRHRRRSRATFFVWAVWGLMTLTALLYVTRFGSNVPSWDDWDMVPTMTGRQPITAQWLWSQHNEHRVPVPRLLLLALNSIFGIDFRTAMYFNVLASAGVAAAAILVAHRLRGSASVPDATLPLLLLNAGHGVNFVWSWQIEFFTSTMLAVAALLLIVTGGARPTWRLALMLGVLLAVLVGSGAHGVALVPAVASWLFLAGVMRWQEASPVRQRDSVVLSAAAIVGVALTALYFLGFERVPYHPSSPGLRATAVTSVQFLTMAYGPAVRHVWPGSGVVLLILWVGAALACLVTLRVAIQRILALGLLAYLGAMGCLAVGIGLGRDGFEPRYVTLAIPALLAAYFIFLLFLPQHPQTVVQWAMFIAAALALGPNVSFGLTYARELRSRLAAFEKDITEGVPPYKLIHDYRRWLHPHADLVGDYLPMLRAAGVQPYVHLVDDPPFRERPVPLAPEEVHDVQWDGATSTARATGAPGHVVFKLSQPLYAAGVRLRYTHRKPSGGLPYVSVYWKGGAADRFGYERFSKYSPTGDRANWQRGSYLRIHESQSRLTVWTLERIDAIRIHPDLEPSTFTIHELTVLEPAK